jgi:hypothetical protein
MVAAWVVASLLSPAPLWAQEATVFPSIGTPTPTAVPPAAPRLDRKVEVVSNGLLASVQEFDQFGALIRERPPMPDELASFDARKRAESAQSARDQVRGRAGALDAVCSRQPPDLGEICELLKLLIQAQGLD